MKKWYEKAKDPDCPQITEAELKEVEEFAQRRNDDLLEKLLRDRLYWIQTAAYYSAHLHHAIASGVAWFEGDRKKSKKMAHWLKIPAFASAKEKADNLAYSFMEQPVKQPMGFDLNPTLSKVQNTEGK